LFIVEATTLQYGNKMKKNIRDMTPEEIRNAGLQALERAN